MSDSFAHVFLFKNIVHPIMSDETQTEEEPSIEEILDSIRQIISEDDDALENAAEPKEVTVDAVSEVDPEPIEDIDFDASAEESTEDVVTKVEVVDQSDVDDIDFDSPVADDEGEEPLELTDKVATGENELEIDLVDDPAADVDGISETKPDIEPESDVEAATEPEPEVIEESEPVVEEIKEDIRSEQEEVVPKQEASSDPVDDILSDQAKEAAYTAMSELVRKTAVDHSSTVTIEDIVRSELKPLLHAWLDEHLPTVIDRLVSEELERVSKRVLED